MTLRGEMFCGGDETNQFLVIPPIARTASPAVRTCSAVQPEDNNEAATSNAEINRATFFFIFPPLLG